jgi:formate dehydrogenase iron-sulfur subunit
VELLDRLRAGRGALREQQLTLLDDLCETMAEGSLCGLGGMTPIPVRSVLRHFRDELGS